MAEPTLQKNQRPSLFRHIARTAFHITLPPLAGRYHGRYRGKPHHLAMDTLLAASMFVLAGLAAWALLRQTPTIFSGVQLRIDMPKTIQSGSEIHATFRIENAKATASNLQLRIIAPERWDITAPTVYDGIVWTQDSLATGASATIPLDAIVTGTSGRTYILRANVRYSVNGTEFADIATAQYTVDTSAITTSLQLPDQVVAGQAVSGTLTIRNSTTQPVPEITAALSLPVGVTLLSADPPLDRIAHPLVVFTPGQAITVALRLFVSPTYKEPSAAVTATTLLRKIPQTKDTKELRVLQQTGQTAADVLLLAEPVYWSDAGIQFGYGPLPPKVGERTGYRIFWTVKAGTHALAQGTVRAKLPASVMWQNSATATAGDQPSYSVSERTVEWQFQRVAAAEQISASFDVSVEPIPSDRGKPLMLLEPSTLTATFDNGTNSTSTIGGTWNVLTNPGAEDSGKVVP